MIGSNQSSEPLTIVLSNPQLLEARFTSRVLASLPVNQLPVFSSAPIVAAVAGSSYRYSAQAMDPDGASVTYFLASGPEGATLDAVTGTIDWTPSRAAKESTTFEVRAYDGRNGYRSQTWTVDVQGVNTAPVMAPVVGEVANTLSSSINRRLADAIPQIVVREGDLLSIPISASDVDGDRLFYWADRLPPGATFDAQFNAIRYRPGSSAAGRYERVTAYASDGIAIVNTTFEIVVTNRNTAPSLAAVADRTIREGDSLVISLRGQDDDGDRLRFFLRQFASGRVPRSQHGYPRMDSSFDQHGNYPIEIEVEDGEFTATRSFTINVENVNGPVAFSRLDPFSILEGQTFQIRVAATDAEYPGSSNNPSQSNREFITDVGRDQAPLTYTFTTLPAGASYDSDTGVFRWTPTFTQSGNYRVQFTAADDGDGTGTPSVTTVDLDIQVIDARSAPSLVAIGNQQVAHDTTSTLDVTATDGDGDAIVLSASLDESIVGSLSRLPDFVTFVDQGNGTGRFTCHQPLEIEEVI